MLLETSLLSVKEIMTKVGINDGSHFVRDFKKDYGLTPARFRASALAAITTQENLKERDRKIG